MDVQCITLEVEGIEIEKTSDQVSFYLTAHFTTHISWIKIDKDPENIKIIKKNEKAGRDLTKDSAAQPMILVTALRISLTILLKVLKYCNVTISERDKCLSDEKMKQGGAEFWSPIYKMTK